MDYEESYNDVKPPKRNRSGKVVHTGQKQIIINVYEDILIKDPDIMYNNIVARVSAACGIGILTVKNTISEYKRTGKVSSPMNKKKRPTIINKVDDFHKFAIRQKIHAFWFRREIPTLAKIIQVVNDDPDLPNITRTSFQRLLKSMQFEYTKRYRDSALTEREDLVTWRRSYISDIRRYRQEGRTIYFLDEKLVNAEAFSSRVCVDQLKQSHRDAFLRGLVTESRNSTGKGKLLIVVHIGSAEGFVTGDLLCFESKKNTSDYHDEINGNTFFEWFCSVLPLLKDNSVIVMDNAPYHSVKTEQTPTSSWKKAAIIEWLESKGVETNPFMIKFELLKIVRELKHKYDLYVVDEEAKKQNKIVLRLPPYHCELNPIELVWSVVKGHVNAKNTTFKINDVQQLLNDGIQKVTPEMWSNFVSHTIKEEDKLWQVDYISDEILDEESTSHVLMMPGLTTSDSENSN
ncbi:uncharacterized protein LOC100161011 [Acyrthosiphon pisum]|uniref:Tc1-like transposase DDE domain-containing protein n=1 Tax=Acyrthosiphon pisum TaxID=7029 RepID=A0A8R2AA30_ACYPI|nr:uncharacterized protein LOC100161011 [Acyrthosiphon pisum]|eukprot:XP_001948346.2 PREDICTED: uncharacterized protein LOC100161011 [Acyrthosiphon pisum]